MGLKYEPSCTLTAVLGTNNTDKTGFWPWREPFFRHTSSIPFKLLPFRSAVLTADLRKSAPVLCDE